QAINFLDHSRHRQRGLDRDRVAFDEERFEDRRELAVQFARLVKTPFNTGVTKIADLSRQQVRGYRDDADPAERRDRQHDRVIAGEQLERSVKERRDLGDLRDVSRSFFDAYDVFDLGQTGDGRRFDVARRAALNAVENDRQPG